MAEDNVHFALGHVEKALAEGELPSDVWAALKRAQANLSIAKDKLPELDQVEPATVHDVSP